MSRRTRCSARNGRGGHNAAENLISALRCLYRHAVDDGLIDERDNPARKVAKPRRLPPTRRAITDTQLAEINRVAAITGNDPELDALILRLHTETACRRGGALALRPQDLDREQCLVMLAALPAGRAAAALPERAPDHHAAVRRPVGAHRRGTALGPHPGDQPALAASYDADMGGTQLWVRGRPCLRRPHRRKRGRHVDLREGDALRDRHCPVRADRRAAPPRKAWRRPA